MCGGGGAHSSYESMTERELEDAVLSKGAIQSFKDYLISSLE